MCVFLIPLAAAAVAAGSASAAAAGTITAMTALSLTATAAAGAVSAMGAIESADAQQKQANYQAQVARNNQTIASQNADAATQAGAVQEQNQRFKNAEQMGTIRATLAANGGDIGSGSALDIQSDAARLGEVDALTIRNNAARNAYGYQAQGANFGADAGLDVARGKQAQTAGTMGAASSILGSASQFGNQYANFSKSGLIK